MNPTHQTPSGPVTVDTDAAFLGCLMRCDTSQARPLLAGMRPDDLAQPIAREILALAIRLNLREVAPGPAALYAEARRAGRLDTETKHELLADWLIDTYRAAPDATVGDYLKTAVLEAALRRALRQHAMRVLNHVDHIEADDLTDLATPDDRLADLWQRHHHSTEADPSRFTTPADSSQRGTGEFSTLSRCLSSDHSPATPTPGDDPADAAQTHSGRAEHDRREAA